MTPSLRSAIASLALACLLCGGCQQSGPDGQDAVDHRQPRITYRLKWLFNASTAGDLWADEKGLFRQAGLHVRVKEGGAEQDAIEEIELGRAQFGVASADQILRAVSKGADVLVLAQIFQANPLQWIYMRSRADLEGLDRAGLRRALERLTVGITYGGNDEAIFMALAGSIGLDPQHLHLYAITYDYAPFWRGRVHLWPCYRNTQGIALSEKMEAMGDRPGFLDPSAYGIDFVANSLITSKRFAREYPDTVKRFVRCVLEGWKQALKPENRAEMTAILERYEKTSSEATISRQIEATAALVTLKGQRQVGFIDREAWAKTRDIMFQQGLLKSRIELKGLFHEE